MLPTTNNIIFIVKNALLRKKNNAHIFYSWTNYKVLETLTKSGFIRGFEKITGKNKSFFKVLLKYDSSFVPSISFFIPVSSVARKRSLKKEQAKKTKYAFCILLFNRPFKKFIPKTGLLLSIVK